jgi:DNA-binding GntR family transcriptional regulator
MVVLREQVFAGTFAPGMPLREGLLSESLGVSRHTIRVALSNLSHEGVVRLEANRGAFVRSLTREDVVDTYRLRELVELTAVEHAVAAAAENPSVLGPAQHFIQTMSHAAHEGSWSASRDADLAFHRSLVAVLDSPRMLQTFESLLTDLRLCFLLEGYDSMDLHENAAEHARVFDPIEAGDADQAIAIMREHLRSSRQKALAVIMD